MTQSKTIIIILLALINLITFPIWAENKQDSDIFAGLRRGERVTVNLKNNLSYTGIIKSIINDKIEIDISYDDLVLKGGFSFHSRDIKSILARSTFSKTEKDKIAAEKEKKELEGALELPPKNSDNEELTEPANPTEKKEMKGDELLDLLNKFPQGEKWNGKTYEAIKDKNAFLRTPEETSFMENYQDWLKALELKGKNGDMEFFKKYLPEKGWGEEKYSELITRYLRLKVGLTTEEQEFVDKYEIWKKTRPIYEEEQNKIQEDKKQEEENKASEPTPPPAKEEEPPAQEEKPTPESPQEEKPPEAPSKE